VTVQPVVAFVLPSLNGGGAERATLNLHHHSELETMILVEHRGGDLAGDPMASDAVVIDLPEGARRATRVVALARTLRAHRPKVVVAVLSPLTTGLAARLAGCRTIFWLQNPPDFMAGIQIGKSTVMGRRGLWTLALLANGIAGASPGLLHDWSQAGVSADKLTVLPNGLELPAVLPRRHRSVSDVSPLRLLTIGRLAPQKRHDVLIRALGVIKQQHPAELTILGRGDDEAALRALAQSLALAEHVHFDGFVDDPSKYLAAADLFLLASDFEGFGNVIVEALGHGLSVVCTDVPFGPRFIAGDCDAVRLVPRDDPSAIAREVLTLAREPSSARAAEAHARAHEFSVRRVSAHFDLAIEQLLRGEAMPSWIDRGTPSLKTRSTSPSTVTEVS
jgi:glycosyltransferase involved in cell wall biosynthesis